jgi:hypothetical protein
MRPEASPVLKSSRKRVVRNSRTLHEKLILISILMRKEGTGSSSPSFLH